MLPYIHPRLPQAQRGRRSAGIREMGVT
jgi:hypothetical protein